MKKIENPFMAIHNKIDNESNKEKYDRIMNSNGEALPVIIDVELTNFCNFNCRFCQTGTKTMKRMKGYMPDEVVDAIVDNVSKYKIQGVRFIRWGEPTLHPKYLQIVEKIKQTGTLTHINTNGSLLDEEQIKKLYDIHLDSIKFSFQGADEGTYSEMRNGGDYQKLLNTIHTFYNLRGDRDFPYIQVSTTLTGESAEQIENFKNDVENYCDYYNVGYTILNHINVGEMDISEEEKEKIRKLQQREKNKHVYRKVCEEAFDKLSINWNGDVTLCCADYDNFMIVGNILDNDIKQIFNSKATKIYREAIAKNQYNKIKCCSICYEVIS